MTIFAVCFFLVGSTSLSIITLMRLFGIGFNNSIINNLRDRTIYIILVLIWIVALLAAAPTQYYREYWIRGWKDIVETNCDDNRHFDKSQKITYVWYWYTLISLTVWVPSLILLISFGSLYYKLKYSVKMFPYLSGNFINTPSLLI